jgi:hypothetical protein
MDAQAAQQRAASLLLSPAWPLVARLCPDDDEMNSFSGVVCPRRGADMPVHVALGVRVGGAGGGGGHGPAAPAAATLRAGAVHLPPPVVDKMDAASRRHVQAVSGGGVDFCGCVCLRWGALLV